MIDKIIRSYTENEGPKFLGLIRRLRIARIRGYMQKEDLIAVCNWKSPRARHLCLQNHGNSVVGASRVAFATKDEAERMHALVALSGVSVPMASAILSAYDPGRYGVIDIRVWQALHTYGKVVANKEGINLTIDNWLEYLNLLRAAAKRNGKTARAAEQALFFHHKEVLQSGMLYQSRAQQDAAADGNACASFRRCRG